ncbi:PP2C family protein-serine/threonine phosphatase [Actinacidiphila acididurans]|uniref:Serine/threonine-protein phosphatase n=1 Tax=Actinacidiphila acididurans TaxID=2784346 RepID=A0ABS2TSQ0_9ACTN|nr:PP2C family protein-serine/threonine phosphatase [Actinacidiphila acididurans]MBM9506026.1 serine/threonine-protein phosphatase [Actinacidiphila acididurans]
MSPAHVRKVAGTEPSSAGIPQTDAAAITPAAVPVPPALPAGHPERMPDRGSPEHPIAVQDRLAAWVCDLSLLHELTERLVRTAEPGDVLHEVLQAGATLVGARRGMITLECPDGFGRRNSVGLGLAHADLGALETISATAPTEPVALDVAPEVVHGDLRHGPGLSARHREVAERLGLGASYALPLTAERTGTLGTAVWFYDEPAEPAARQRRLAGLYLRFAAEHLGRCLALARANEAASSLAAELLPARLPRVPGVRMAVRHDAGPRGGGDWYDALPLPEGALGLAVGGVTGAGPGAVAAMGRLRASLRAYAVMEGEDPVAVLSDLELLLRLTEPARAATALFGYATALPGGGRRLVLAGAGHCPPLVVGDRRCEYVETSLSAPLNMLSCWEAPSVEMCAHPGESLLLYTDGLLHRTGEPVDRAFARLHAAAQGAPHSVRADPERLADHVVRAMLPDGVDRTDGVEDLVLMVARFD